MIDLLRSAFDWCRRHWLIVGLTIGCLYYLGGEKEILHSVVTCYLLASMALMFAGIAVYAFTSLNLIKTGDTRAIGHIYLGTFLLFGLVYFGDYFAQFRP